jgi:rhodanese-related sulfurtransferase
MPLTHWPEAKKGFLLDVRERFEIAVEDFPDAVHIPIGELRARMGELPRDKEINVICRSGQRAYIATRMLIQSGYKAKTISGGLLSHAHKYLFNTNNIEQQNLITNEISNRKLMLV